MPRHKSRKTSYKSTFSDKHAQKVLELDKILAILQQRCAGELGKTLVGKIRPSTDHAKVLLYLRETSEARAGLDAGITPSFSGLADLDGIVLRAEKGAVLDALDLGKVARFALGAERLKKSLKEIDAEQYPRLYNLRRGVVDISELQKVLLRAIDINNDTILDKASVRLLKARRSMAATKDRIQERLRSLTSNPDVQSHLQDNFVTVRNGRYCLPVKAESRSAVPGIVHDRSSSGGAVFIEPQSIVDANNRLREWEAEENAAIEEILRDLSQRVGEASLDLQRIQKAAAKLDFAFAKGHLSQMWKASEPVLSESPQTHLRQARHPLIENPVPNDIILGTDFDVLLITGPNTGGKTVVLKTLGLLTLMAACGLHLPVNPKSEVWIPQHIFADIGDEQSLEQSLSTFSAHLRNVLQVVKYARAGDLVLLDEIGAGTDPDEGAALAKAILRNLARRKALVVASTHFGELKRFALSAQRFKNASVEFDERSFRPTYALRIGVPGSSNALHIAQRLGMPADLIQRARRYLGEEHQRSENMAQRLEEAERELREHQESLQQGRENADKLQQEYEKKLAQLEREKSRIIEQAQEETRQLLQETQQESDAILRELRQQRRESKKTEVVRGRLKTLRKKTAKKLPKKSTFDEITAKISTPKKEKPEHVAEENEERAPQRFEIGETVLVKQFNREGEVLSLPKSDGKIDVRIGAMRLHVEPFQLKSLRQQRPVPARINVHIPAANSEINLIGKTADEAIYELEAQMDVAILAGLKSLWIIHGRGTGTLRKAVHQWLDSNRAVTEYELAPLAEGGEGATVAHLE